MIWAGPVRHGRRGSLLRVERVEQVCHLAGDVGDGHGKAIGVALPARDCQLIGLSCRPLDSAWGPLAELMSCR
jgi:hypothetical protein